MPYNYRQLDNHASATPKSGTSTSKYPQKSNNDGESRYQRSDNAKSNRDQKKRDDAYYVKKYVDYGELGEYNYSIRDSSGAGGRGASPKAMRDIAEIKYDRADKKAVKSKNKKTNKR